MFVVLDLPFFFIYFRGMTHAALTVLSRVLLYPFVVWQTIMLMWVLILLPITLWRQGVKLWKKLRNTLPIAHDHEHIKKMGWVS